MTEAPAIEIRDLHKSYRAGRSRVDAVCGLSLVVRRGEVFGLLGPNGAGKTTTVEICEGLLAADAGEVTVLGQTWGAGDRHALRRRLGVTLQQSHFFDRQTVGETLALFASFHGGCGRSAADCVDLLALHDKVGARTRDLSGGQRQRLAVACALVGAPELLFLDEPTTGLDPQSRRQLWDIVRQFRADGGTVLITTHYMEEAEQLCDRVAIVDRGQCLVLGRPAELVASVGGDHIVEIEAAGLATAWADFDPTTLPGVRSVRRRADALALTVGAPHVALPPLIAALARADLHLDGLTTRHTSLEDVFVRLTGRHLRDAS